MNCEQVEEGLSAYLDNMLAPAERRELAIHLQSCPRCMALLAELRQNDMLLAHLPRISPSPVLRERIFSVPEVVALVAQFDHHLAHSSTLAHPPRPSQQPAGELARRAQWISLEGGRAPQTVAEKRSSPQSQLPTYPAPSPLKARKRAWFTPLKIAIAAALIVALGTASLLSLNLRHQTASNANTLGAITPPAAGPVTGQTIPLAAGTRFVFLRGGTLWSTLVDGNSHQPERLTPVGVTVAAEWMVNPTMPGHTAGNMLAYIDLQKGMLHTIRSDGQQDTPIPQPLFKVGNSPAAWESATGETILGSLAWSPDGNTLAFLGDPTGSGRTSLYLYSIETGRVQKVSPDLTGSISRPIWSPDSTRLAFALASAGVVNVLDYNVQNQKVLNLSNLATAQGDSTNGILTLGWSLSTSAPAVTWSLGSIGHISSVWVHRVGAGGTLYPQLLVSGDYLQALYSPNSAHGTGSWLLVAALAGQAGDIWRIDLVPGAGLIPLTRGKQVSFVRWSPDGSLVFYLDGQSSGMGKGHVVDLATGADRLFSDNVAIDPVPAWSVDSRQLAYSTGVAINISSTLDNSQALQLHLQGQDSALTWSPGAQHQLIVVLSGATSGIYLVDTQRNTSLQLDHLGTNGSIQWSEIP